MASTYKYKLKMTKDTVSAHDNRFVTIKMRRIDALRQGLLTCKSCGYPPNNHFDFDDKKCAFDDGCTGYEEAAIRGELVKPKRKRK